MTRDDDQGRDWPGDLAAMHERFGVRDVVARLGREELAAFLEFRLEFLEEELDEATDAETPEDLVDALVDLCVVALGTLDALGVDARLAWAVVHRANMAKTVGVNPRRANPFGLPDLTKPEGWTPPDHAGNVGLLSVVYGTEGAA